MKPLLSINDLSRRLGIPRARLESIAEAINSHYNEWPLIDKNNPAKVRQVRSPRPELMNVQKLLVRHIFSQIPVHESVHGGMRGRSAKTNAVEHLGQDCVITLDVKQFYDRVRHEVVYRLFCKELGIGRDVARLMTRLTTLDDALPQGAPTSLAIANLLLRHPLDIPVSISATTSGIRNTRFVDDIALSGSNTSNPRNLINDVAKSLSRRQLPMYRMPNNAHAKSKLKIMPSSGPQVVTGLIVNRADGPSISRKKRSQVRSAIHKLQCTTKEERVRALKSIEGRIQHVGQFNPGSAKRLKTSLRAVLDA